MNDWAKQESSYRIVCTAGMLAGAHFLAVASRMAMLDPFETMRSLESLGRKLRKAFRNNGNDETIALQDRYVGALDHVAEFLIGSASTKTLPENLKSWRMQCGHCVTEPSQNRCAPLRLAVEVLMG